MVDDVKIVGIDDTVSRNIDWAKERTLQQLVAQGASQTRLLGKMSGLKDTELKNLVKTDAKLGRLGSAAEDTADALDESNAKRRRTDRELQESVRDLRYSLGSYSRQIGSFISDSTNPLRSLPGAIESTTSGLAMMTKGSRVATASLLLVGSVLKQVVERFIEGAESYRGMMQSGVMFDGSISTMIQSVRSAGVSISDASQVITEYSQAMMAVGERTFFRSIENSAQLFARLGMNQTQGMQAFAELDEMRRLSGLAYMQSEEDRVATNTQLVQLMQSQATLTGVSVRRQREEARRAAQSERVRFLQAGMSREQLAAQTQSITRMTSMGFSQELIEGVLLEAMTGAANQTTAAARQAIGPQFEAILQSVRGGRPEDIGGVSQREDIARYTTQFAQAAGSGLALANAPMARLLVSQNVLARETARAATEAAPGQEAVLRDRQERAARIARGESVLDETTQGYFNTVNQAAVAMGRVESMIMRLADNVLAPLMTGLSSLTTSVNNLVGSLGGFNNQGVFSSIGNVLSNPLALLGIAGAGAGLYAMRGAAGAATGAVGNMFRAPATPGLGALGAGPGTGAAGATGAGLLGRLGMLGGVAGGGLGLGMGAMQAAGGETFGSRMLGVGTTALSGAAMGAMFGPIGAAIGGAAGLGVGLLSNLFGGGGAAAPGTPGALPAGVGGTPDFAASINQLNNTMTYHLGPDGAIATTLRQLIEVNNQVERNTARVANNYS
jgi:hypothetical protein